MSTAQGPTLDHTCPKLAVGRYPTQAKTGLEWDTQPLLLVQGVGLKAAVSRLPRISYVPATKAGCPIQARFWLEWDTTALDQWWWMNRVSTQARKGWGTIPKMICPPRPAVGAP
jgi:hypothetical protein